MIESKIIQNLESLIKSGNNLRVGNEYEQVTSQQHREECLAWIASVLHTVSLIFPAEDAAYRSRIQKIVAKDAGFVVQQHVGAVTGILEYIKKDIDNGLLATLSDSVRAEVFDDFIDHADEYLKGNYKNEAGVIAGVVFEDSVRRLCCKHSITETGIKLDQLITELATKSIISATKAKRFRVAAHVRTKATHAQWTDFDISDVKETIIVSRDIIDNYLDS